MIIYQEFLAINEELAAFDPSERLRYAVHEILIRMKDRETIKFQELSIKLRDEFKINISSELLKQIFENWDKHLSPDYSVFKKEDKNWMDVFPYQNHVMRKVREKQNFGKHRKKNNVNNYNINSHYNNYNKNNYYRNGDWGLDHGYQWD